MKTNLTMLLILIILSGCYDEPEKTKREYLREIFNKQHKVFDYHFDKWEHNYIDNPEIAKKHSDSMGLAHYMNKVLYEEMYSEMPKKK